MTSTMAPSAGPGGADWASLPVELLGVIAERLFLVDYIRFGAVCTSWYLAVFPNTTLFLPFAPKMPYLLLPGKDRELSDHCFLFNLADKLLHRISPLPELRDRWFVGSQFGWLLISDLFANPSLLNPLTGSQIPLPPIFPPPFIDPFYSLDGSLSCYETESGLPVGSQMQSLSAPYDLKLILSSNPMDGSFEAVAIYCYERRLLFLRSGEEKWYELDSPYCFADAIYRNGEFRLLTSKGRHMLLDLSIGTGASLGLVMVPWSSKKEIDASSDEEDSPGSKEEGISRYLVDSLGDLLQVCRYGPHPFRVRPFFYVSKWDDEKGYWEPVETLGGRSLFVGTSSSFSLAADEIPGLKINSVYFTDDDWTYTEDRVCDIVVFSLEDGSVESCHPHEHGLNWPLPIWITPALSWMDRRRHPN